MKQINNVIDFLESLNKVGRIYIIVAFDNSYIECMNIHKDTYRPDVRYESLHSQTLLSHALTIKWKGHCWSHKQINPRTNHNATSQALQVLTSPTI